MKSDIPDKHDGPSRRRFLKATAAGVVAVAGGGASPNLASGLLEASSVAAKTLPPLTFGYVRDVMVSLSDLAATMSPTEKTPKSGIMLLQRIIGKAGWDAQRFTYLLETIEQPDLRKYEEFIKGYQFYSCKQAQEYRDLVTDPQFWEKKREEFAPFFNGDARNQAIAAYVREHGKRLVSSASHQGSEFHSSINEAHNALTKDWMGKYIADISRRYSSVDQFIAQCQQDALSILPQMKRVISYGQTLQERKAEEAKERKIEKRESPTANQQRPSSGYLSDETRMEFERRKQMSTQGKLKEESRTEALEKQRIEAAKSEGIWPTR